MQHRYFYTIFILTLKLISIKASLENGQTSSYASIALAGIKQAGSTVCNLALLPFNVAHSTVLTVEKVAPAPLLSILAAGGYLYSLKKEHDYCLTHVNKLQRSFEDISHLKKTLVALKEQGRIHQFEPSFFDNHLHNINQEHTTFKERCFYANIITVLGALFIAIDTDISYPALLLCGLIGKSLFIKREQHKLDLSYTEHILNINSFSLNSTIKSLQVSRPLIASTIAYRAPRFSCLICLENMCPEQHLVTHLNGCSTHFHKDCFNEYARHQGPLFNVKCPYCAQVITEESLFQIERDFENWTRLNPEGLPAEVETAPDQPPLEQPRKKGVFRWFRR